jgi:hypothetical protein
MFGLYGIGGGQGAWQAAYAFGLWASRLPKDSGGKMCRDNQLAVELWATRMSRNQPIFAAIPEASWQPVREKCGQSSAVESV